MARLVCLENRERSVTLEIIWENAVSKALNRIRDNFIMVKSLSLANRILFVNVFIISIFSYVGLLYTLPTSIWKKIKLPPTLPPRLNLIGGQFHSAYCMDSSDENEVRWRLVVVQVDLVRKLDYSRGRSVATDWVVLFCLEENMCKPSCVPVPSSCVSKGCVCQLTQLHTHPLCTSLKYLLNSDSYDKSMNVDWKVNDIVMAYTQRYGKILEIGSFDFAGTDMFPSFHTMQIVWYRRDVEHGGTAWVFDELNQSPSFVNFWDVVRPSQHITFGCPEQLLHRPLITLQNVATAPVLDIADVILGRIFSQVVSQICCAKEQMFIRPLTNFTQSFHKMQAKAAQNIYSSISEFLLDLKQLLNSFALTSLSSGGPMTFASIMILTLNRICQIQ